jgi:2-keto-3-deoxy-6-phosphogluconate aldolase
MVNLTNNTSSTVTAMDCRGRAPISPGRCEGSEARTIRPGGTTTFSLAPSADGGGPQSVLIVRGYGPGTRCSQTGGSTAPYRAFIKVRGGTSRGECA